MGKVVKLGVYSMLLLSLAYLALRSISSWQQGYSWKEMDWHGQGYTSLNDFLASSDIGKREIKIDGKICAEFFLYKDGLPIKTVCHE